MKKFLFFFAFVTVMLAGCEKAQEPERVSVTDVTMKSVTNISVGETQVFEAIVAPDNAANKRVFWQSSNPQIARVDSRSGEVTGVRKGIALITVTTNSGSKTASCAVNVFDTEWPDFDEENGVLALIPDPMFRAFCKNAMVYGFGTGWYNGQGEIWADPWDTDGDGMLSFDEAAGVKEITADGLEIASLVGVEHFINLERLYCRGNRLTSLNISKNSKLGSVDCTSNQLTSLDISKNNKLVSVDCASNKITEIDITKNPLLQTLECQSNQLTSLDVSQNPALVNLLCDNNAITSLDLTGNPRLYYLSCGYNGLTSLDFSKNPALYILACENNALTSLDLSVNIELSELHCQNNRLISIDISNNSGLGFFLCYGNPGDGSTFQVTAWFDNSSMPSGLNSWGESYRFTTGSWRRDDGKEINVDYIEGEPPVLYVSTDYSADGRVTQLQRSTVGDGIDIVFMGDGYSDRLIADGSYDRLMRKSMEYFFAEEPYKSFRDMFNVWVVDVVSPNEVYTPVSQTALSGSFGEGTLAEGDNDKCMEYALKAIPEEKMDNAVIVVIMNSFRVAGTCYMYMPMTEGDYGGGLSISFFSLWINELDFKGVLNHEANGHGFAKLDDEYYYYGTSFDDDTAYMEMIPYGWWKNTDLTSDPTKVKWAKFLTDPRYAGQGLGVFEGGSTYEKGVWRPTELSIMHNNQGGFNAPSREAIYYKINKLAYGAEWQYDYEEFVTWDARNSTAARAAASVTRGGKGVLKPLSPPVIIPHSWKE